MGLVCGTAGAQVPHPDSGTSVTVTSDPVGALIELHGRVRATGVTPFTAIGLPPGTYRARSAEPGYTATGNELVLPLGGQRSMSVNVVPKGRTAAAIRSLLVPGWGQAYSERTTAMAVQRTVSGATLFVASYAALVYSGARSDYDDAYESYRDIGAEYGDRAGTELESARVAAAAAHGDMMSARGDMQAALTVAAVAWAWNVCDAALFFPGFDRDILPARTSVGLVPETGGGARFEVTHALR